MTEIPTSSVDLTGLPCLHLVIEPGKVLGHLRSETFEVAVERHQVDDVIAWSRAVACEVTEVELGEPTRIVIRKSRNEPKDPSR